MLGSKNIKISFDIPSILSVVGTLALIFIVWEVRSIFIMFFLAVILSSTLKHVVLKYEQKLKLPNWLAMTLLLLIFFSFLIGIVYLVVDNLRDGLGSISVENPIIQSLSTSVSDILSKYQNSGNEIFDSAGFDVKSILNDFGTVIGVFSNTFGHIANFIFVIMISMYLLLGKGNFYDGLVKFLPKNKQLSTITLIQRIETKMGAWLWAQALLMLIIGGLTYIGLTVPLLFVDSSVFTIGKFAISLAVLAGLLEAIPNIGPLITTVLAILVALATGGAVALPQVIYITLYFLFIQQMENAVIVPRIMKGVVGMDPVVTILSVGCGLVLGGPIGAIFSIPIVVVAKLAIEFFTTEE